MYNLATRPEPCLQRQVFVCLVIVALAIACAPSANAQNFQVIYNFTGGLDGALPPNGLSMDSSGTFYGTNTEGGRQGGYCPRGGCGTVFKMVHNQSGWVVTPLYNFLGGNDGLFPPTRVIPSQDGRLYGTTQYGGGGPCQHHDGNGCGTVFELSPPAPLCRNSYCFRAETILYRFQGGVDGAYPDGELIFDQVGNLYGTASGGGNHACGGGCGLVYKLSHSNGTWTQSVLYTFAGGEDGGYPQAHVTFDGFGNLYGTTMRGGSDDCGTVFEIMPSQSGWTKKTLYEFSCGDDGRYPVIGVTFDEVGNLYSATWDGGRNGGGTVFKLAPSGDNWIFTLVYSFSGTGVSGPGGDMVFRNGNLYGTTSGDGVNEFGNVFRLSPSGNDWTYTSLYDFRGGNDGAAPWSTLIFDSDGNMYGTTLNGELHFGNVFEITP